MDEELKNDLLSNLVEAIMKAERGIFPESEIELIKLWLKNNAPKYYNDLTNNIT